MRTGQKKLIEESKECIKKASFFHSVVLAVQAYSSVPARARPGLGHNKINIKTKQIDPH